MYNVPKVAPKAISKAKNTARSKAVKYSKPRNLNDERRLVINERERQRTTTMNQAFDQLKRLLNPSKEYSKTETLAMVNRYITFLHRMANDEAFFNQYAGNSISVAFQIYLIRLEQEQSDGCERGYESDVSNGSDQLAAVSCQ